MIWIVLALSAVVLFLAAWAKLKHISKHWKRVRVNDQSEVHHELVDGAHGQWPLISFVISQQGTMHRTTTNTELYSWEMAHHGDNKPETMACIKDHFDPNTTNNILEDNPGTPSCLGKCANFLKKL